MHLVNPMTPSGIEPLTCGLGISSSHRLGFSAPSQNKSEPISLWDLAHKAPTAELSTRAVLRPRLDRLMARVSPEPNSGCWLFMGFIDNAGYGQVRYNGRRISAHRAYYEAFVGPVSDGLEPDHRCRNRCCVNPAHLEIVTHRENTRRGFGPPGINARKTHCLRGHPFDLENTEVRKDGNRGCKACSRLRAALRARRGGWTVVSR